VWRPVWVASIVLAAISAVVIWNWHMLETREQVEIQRRFDNEVTALGQMVQTRMTAYEAVLRGASSAFAGGSYVSQTQWHDIVNQTQVQELYPGISSIAWSRYLRAQALDEFVARTRADGYPDFQVFPAGEREHYQLVEYAAPITARTDALLGLDLFTQTPQNQVLRQAIDSGQITLSMPLNDLYAVSPEPGDRMGAMLYLPVYRSGARPDSVAARRAALVGVAAAAFRGDELAEGIFGSLLPLFHIVAHDVQANQTVFDSQQQAHMAAAKAPPSGWQPRFHAALEIPLYGRTWRLGIDSTPQYEQAWVTRSHDMLLFMGLAVALLAALVAGGFVWQRDRQLFASEQTAARLRDQAEQLMLANRYKSEFLANMSHELRTPLNSILILSDQLRQNAGGNLNEKQARHADIVYRAGSDLLQLINDVLDLAKVEAGRMQLTMEPLSLQDLLVDLDASMRPLAEAKKLNLYIPPVSDASGVPPRVFTDRVRLHQILRNLLSNAIKFTDQGQVHLGVSVGETRQDGSVLIQFSVRDTGIGIAPEQHARAFEAFQQLDGSTRRRFGGTGLGLAITRQLAQALDGDISLESAPGQGSTFTVSLPMQAVAALAPGDIPAPQRAGAGQPLLIVEDDANFAAVIADKAHSHGFATVHCVTGGQALDLLKDEPFAAIVLDILLPDISGWQLFRRLRALPSHRHTPVHIISCLPQPDGLTEHGTHYLTKPIEQDALEQALASLKDDADSARSPTLLLVEDVEAEREHYRQRLAELGFAVTACETAAETRALWPTGAFDVLVLDLNLPDSDGFALLDSLDALRSLSDTRVVVNTGLNVGQEGLQRLSAYSAVVVRKKGDDTEKLGQAVQGFLDSIHSAAAGNGAAATTRPGMATTMASTAESTAAPAVAQQSAAAAAANPEATPVTAQTRASLQGRRLLLVDDDIRNVYAMSALLDDLGLSIVTAGNGEEAIAAFQQTPLDLILMDMSMPVMDGYVATNLLKTEHGCTAPIIALTAHAMKGDREKCLAAGADDYLSKPVDREKLRTMLERWLAASMSGQIAAGKTAAGQAAAGET